MGTKTTPLLIRFVLVVSHFIPKYPSRPLDEHLSEWREALTLILANRPVGSGEAIKSLGALLKENKWIDAAEIW